MCGRFTATWTAVRCAGLGHTGRAIRALQRLCRQGVGKVVLMAPGR